MTSACGSRPTVQSRHTARATAAASARNASSEPPVLPQQLVKREVIVSECPQDKCVIQTVLEKVPCTVVPQDSVRQVKQEHAGGTAQEVAPRCQSPRDGGPQGEQSVTWTDHVFSHRQDVMQGGGTYPSVPPPVSSLPIALGSSST